MGCRWGKGRRLNRASKAPKVICGEPMACLSPPSGVRQKKVREKVAPKDRSVIWWRLWISEHCLVDILVILGWHVHFCGNSCDSLLLSALEPWNCCFWFWSVPFFGKWGGFMPATSWQTLSQLNISSFSVTFLQFGVRAVRVYRISPKCLVGWRSARGTLQKKASGNLLKSLLANGRRQIPKWHKMSTLVFLFCQLDSAPPLHKPPCLPQPPGKTQLAVAHLNQQLFAQRHAYPPLQLAKLLAEKRSSGKLCYLLAYHGFLDDDWWEPKGQCESSWSTVLQVQHLVVVNVPASPVLGDPPIELAPSTFTLACWPFTCFSPCFSQNWFSQSWFARHLWNATTTRSRIWHGREDMKSVTFLSTKIRGSLWRTPFSQSLPPSLPLTGMRQAPLTVLARRCIRPEVVNGQTAELC